jgi:DNA polymerase-3 subunit gamma/tau
MSCQRERDGVASGDLDDRFFGFGTGGVCVMAYEVIARKWRPQQFDDVVGQEHVTQTLRNAISSDRIHHAYLFVGPRGIGKTSVARIFAKAMNCLEGGPTVTPCDKCDSCREIMSGSSLDVLEIDGASNNGVEQVRELRETVKFAATRGNFKIYIIDEVHMLSTAAFNALLKTLEEPPPHVKFMFATTEPEKVLATIVSRCQRFDLRRIAVPKIVERLELIAKTDKIKADTDALLAIARGAEGGLRDAQSAFDQLISFKGKSITEDDVLSVFGLVARQTLDSLSEHVLTGDIKGLIALVEELDSAGKDLQRLVIELMAHFRNLLICLNVDDPSSSLDLTPEQVETLVNQAKLTNTGRLLRIADVLSETEDRMRYALSRRTLLETALIRCARAATVVTIEEILVKINALRSGDGRDAAKAEVRQTAASFVATAAAAPPPRAAAAARPSVAAAARSHEEELSQLKSEWAALVERVGQNAVGVRGALRDSQPIAVDDLHVKIGFAPEFSEQMENFKSARARTALQHALKGIVRRDVSAVFEPVDDLAPALVQEPEAPEPVYEIPDSEPTSVAERSESSRPHRTRADWQQNSSVQQVLDAFNGTILDVRE